MINTATSGTYRARGPVTDKARGPYRTPEEIEALVRAFEAGTLPRSEWTHRAHLTVALWYLLRHPEREATAVIREGIKSYNARNGILMTKDGGYHETITLFWVWAARRYLSSARLRCTVVNLANCLVQRYGDNRLPFEYYSRDRLMSWEARTSWVEPDLKPLD